MFIKVIGSKCPTVKAQPAASSVTGFVSHDKRKKEILQSKHMSRTMQGAVEST